MQKFKVVLMVLALTLAIAGNTFAQEGEGDGPTPIVSPAETQSAGVGGGATYTVWRGSEPYDGTAASDMASEEADGATEGKDRFERSKPYVRVSD